MTEHRWRTHFLILMGSLFAFSSLVFGFVLLVDPYDNIPFSPPFDRRPVDRNQRYSFPAVARDSRYDSAIFGTSTVALLDPERLSLKLGGQFANLSLLAGTAWEQSRLIALFNRHHPMARRLILGIDGAWCKPGEELEKFTQFTKRPFPEWMYDESPWNDLTHLFNNTAVRQAWRQLRVMLGLRESRFRRDGYNDFLPPDQEYDPIRARETIYGSNPPAEPISLNRDAVRPSCQHPVMQFPAMGILRDVLSQTNANTEIDIVFVPTHVNALRLNTTATAACKARVLELASQKKNVRVLDFMIPSRITSEDSNFWDVGHYREPVARELELLLAEGIREQGASPLFERLDPDLCNQ
jgi:hypothetical protein